MSTNLLLPLDLPPRRRVPTIYVQNVRAQVLREDAVDKLAAVLREPSDIVRFYREVISLAPWFDSEREMFVVVHLNLKSRVRSFDLVSLGTATATLAHPREVFRTAIIAGATAIICLHNHPSGDPSPSSADLAITRVIREAARVVQIDLIDHVVVGEAAHDPTGRGYYSFRQAGIV